MVMVDEERGQEREDSRRASRTGCWVTFLTGGECKPDGSDIRVVGADGRPVRSFILAMGPGDLVRLAFEPRGTSRQRYYIYHGNPEAAAEKPDRSEWRPEGGILLETWRYAGGSIDTAEAIRAAVESAKSAAPLGRAYVPAISIGGNIFGPDERTCSLYTGTLQCRQDGRYKFVLSSFDGSALYIDNRLAVAWPGRHRWVGDVRHQGELDLKAGNHSFALYHVNPTGRHGIVAAWMPPAAATARVLEAGFFAPIARGRLGPLEKARKELAADFTFRQTGFAAFESQGTVPLYRYEFSANQSGSRRGVTYRWQFGDGQEATGEAVEHVFLREGIATVTLEATKGGRTDTTTHRVYIGPNRLNPQEKPDPLTKFEPVLSSYRFSSLSPEDATKIMDFFLILNREGKAIETGRAAVQGGGAAAKGIVPLARKTAELTIDQNGDYAGATTLLERPLKSLKPGSGLYHQLAAQAAAIYVNYLGEDKKAEALLRSCTGLTTNPVGTTDKLFALAWGDLFRFRGNRELAELFYRQAQTAADPTRQFAHSGAYVTAVEDYLRRREYAEARKLLDRWQSEYPLERLGGYSCLLRYRLFRAQRHYTQARLLAETMERVDPFGFYSRQIAKESGKKDSVPTP